MVAPIVQTITLPQTVPGAATITTNAAGPTADPLPPTPTPVPPAVLQPLSTATPAAVFPTEVAQRYAPAQPPPGPPPHVAEVVPSPLAGLLPLPSDEGGSTQRLAGLLAFVMGLLPLAPPGGKLGMGPPPHLAVLLLGLLLTVAFSFAFSLRDDRRRGPRGFATLALRPG